MSRPNPRPALLLGVCVVLAAGCGSSPAATGGAPPAAAGSRTPGMSPGMVMPDGSTMDAQAPTGSPSATDAPPELAAMVCGAEIRGDVATILALPAPPPASSTWADHLYTCTYQLPVGPLVLSVRHFPGAAAARRHHDVTRRGLGPTKNAAALGEHAYRTATGTVGLVKDNFTLTVDATALPAQFGPQEQKRTDLAYEVASVVLGCWTGDDGH